MRTPLLFLALVAGASVATALPTSVPATNAPSARDAHGVDGSSVVVAILDTGVDDEHPDLAGRFANGADVTTAATVPCTNPDDTDGRGTHAAGVALGARGMAPGARLLDVKVAASANAVDSAALVRGIEWVLRYNAGEACGAIPARVAVVLVAHATTGPGDPTDTLAHAVAEASAAGVLVVAPVGDCGPDGDAACRTGDNAIGSPAIAPASLAVAASDTSGTAQREDDRIALFGSRGPGGAGGRASEPKPNLAAPGTQVASACHAESGEAAGSTCERTGTAVAAAHVAGAVALLLDAKPSLSPAEAKALLARTAEKRTGLPWDPAWGSGYLDLEAALRSATRVNRPPVALGGAGGCAPPRDHCVRFDASLSSDADGAVATHRWIFGDGREAPDAVVEHVYDRPGSYRATLVVTDDDGASATWNLTVEADAIPEDAAPNRAPRAALTASPAVARVGEPFRFDASASTDADGTIVAIHWDFGDGGATASGAVVEHAFDRNGTYNVTVLVFDDRGSAETARASVTVVPASQDVIPRDATAPVVTLLAPAHGEALPWGPFEAQWKVVPGAARVRLAVDGKDAGPMDSDRIVLALDPGPHVLRVTATDADGNVGSDRVQFTVSPPARPASPDPPAENRTPSPAGAAALAAIAAGAVLRRGRLRTSGR